MGATFPRESCIAESSLGIDCRRRAVYRSRSRLAIEEARGKVIGPAGSVREALMLIEQHLVQAAILDVNLSDRDVTPIAELLIGGGVPVMFYSGLDLPVAFRERYPSAWFCKKPTPAAQLLNELVASMPK
jgi:hypothetical protein